LDSPMAETVEALAARLVAAPYAASVGASVEEIAAERVRIAVPFRDDNANPGGALHGGVYASTIDIAAAIAAQGAFCPAPDPLEAWTLDLSVVYLSAAINEAIAAEARVLRRGKEIVSCEVEVRTASGKPVARGLSTVRVVPQAGAPAHALIGRVPEEEPGAAASEPPKIARMMMSVPFIAKQGMKVDRVADGHAVLRMPWRDALADADGAVHEGALAALLDTAGATAAWSVAGFDLRFKASTVAIHLNVHDRARGEDVVARAETIRRRDEIFLNRVAIAATASRRQIATGSVTYRIVT